MKPKDDNSELKKLEEELKRFDRKAQPAAREARPAALAMRTGVELVAGVLVGAGIGIVLDRSLGTTPLFLVICFFLGAAGGALNLYRAATAQSRAGTGVNENVTKKDGKES